MKLISTPAIAQMSAMGGQMGRSDCLWDDLSDDLELSDTLVCGEDEEPLSNLADVALQQASRHPSGDLGFLEACSASVAELTATVAEIRASSSLLLSELTAETLTQQLSLGYGLGATVSLRTTASGAGPAARFQHQSHTFGVCNLWTGEQVVIDVGFKLSLRQGCSTPEYQRLLDALPLDFVGTIETLRQVLHLVSSAAAVAFAAHGMLVPPWRTFSGMLLRWTSTTYVDLSPTALQLPHQARTKQNLRKPAAGSMNQIPRALPGDHQAGVAGNVIIGFPSGVSDAQGPASLPFPLCRLQPPPTMKHVSQQIDRLLGPVRKVKLGCV